MSGYSTIRLSEPNPTILRPSEFDFLESNTIWPIPHPTFSKFGAKFGRKGVIFDDIFDSLGIRIWRFEILNYPNRTESDFLTSNVIIHTTCVRNLLSHFLLKVFFCWFSNQLDISDKYNKACVHTKSCIRSELHKKKLSKIFLQYF